MISRSQQILLALTFAATPLAAIHAATSEGTSYKNWYQIEVVIFKQSQPLVSDEVWPLETIAYPEEMISVAPSDDTQITPYRLSQLEFINDPSEPLTGESFEAIDTEVAQDDFLFGDQGNASHNRQLLESINRPRIPIVEANPEEEERRNRLDGMNELLGDGLSEDGFSAAGLSKDGLSGEGSPDEMPGNAAVSSAPGLDFNLANQLLDRLLPEAFRSLGDNKMELNKIARSLRRSSKYQLVLHEAWLQPINSKPTAVLIQAGDRYDDLYDIDGTLSFSRSRFLHVRTDLWFTRFEQRYNQQQLMSLAATDLPGNDLPENAGDYPDLVALEKKHDTYIAVHSYPLRHSRRMRSSVLHYIDHPFFGILVKINRFDYSPEPESDAANGAAE